MVPNRLSVVADLARQFPQEWRDAHNPSGGGPHTEAFIKRVAWALHQEDARWGLNGKRGKPDDLSDDALNWRGEGPGHDPTNNNEKVTVIDCIAGAGGPNPQPVWQVLDHLPGPGAWVKPQPVGGVVVPPTTDLARYWTTEHRVLVSRLAGASTVTVAQQLAFSFPNDGWGNKSTRPGSTVSNDVISRQVDGHLVGVRIGTNEIFYIDGQTFVQVIPTNHLGIAPPPVDPIDPPVDPIEPIDPVPPPPLVGLTEVLDALKALEIKVDALRQDVINAVKQQKYKIDATTKLFGRETKITGTINPKD